ncbi:MAG: DUF1835 domain-containing protein [Komarekiella atlantica HA4396-MV6]|jgi:hypothetical protein|nr:DUF1835 domain-containing protein [Komarekiella atlantica HA4396-MV6]
MSNPRQPLKEERLSLEQQKKRAKDLLFEYRADQELALKRFQQYHPKAFQIRDFAAFQPQLSDAQLVIARENGLPSWVKLKEHIQRITQASEDISRGVMTAFDADLKTLHLRCGSDIQNKLAIAGFCGDFLEFADPYCQGPIPPNSNLSQFLNTRAAFISEAYGVTLKDAQNRLEREYSQLCISHQYERVMLWFEHDPYDQLVLAHVLHHFWKIQSFPKHLELICIDSFPGVERFVGLGQLSSEALCTLWERRHPITRQQLQLGDRVWKALSAESPQVLIQIVNTGTPEIPPMAKALRRHLQELPWVKNGLSLTQQLTLSILADKETMRVDKLFGTLVAEKEPLPYLGDTMYWYVLTQMLQSKRPPLEITTESLEEPWYKRVLQLTKTGHALVQGEVNWLEINSSDRWVGGIRLTSGQPVWMWDDLRNQPILQ